MLTNLFQLACKLKRPLTTGRHDGQRGNHDKLTTRSFRQNSRTAMMFVATSPTNSLFRSSGGSADARLANDLSLRYGISCRSGNTASATMIPSSVSRYGVNIPIQHQPNTDPY
jgi:hypothetical protein